MNTQKKTKSIVNDAIIKDIAAAVGSLEYGTVTIKVLDSRIIQIETSEIKRFDDVWHLEGGGGI